MRALLAGVLLFGACGFAIADECQRAELQSICAFLNNTQTLRAKFKQELLDEQGELLEDGAGMLWLERPARFRWHYTAPWERLIIADDDTLWLYDAELDQVTARDSAGTIEQTPAGLLAGRTEVLANFRVVSADAQTVTLVPTTPADFRQISLQFDGEDLRRLDLEDRFGQRTIIRFGAIDRNVDLDDALFEFEPPANADLIDQRATAETG